ncbi:aromatic ring-hydroxylating dioxygenase subunit alpha [Pseudenhygromyxa sp. WMMC2535]|uniref:aromatic ring-hydroxylating oxygenase subunit alpha n=1 Tax=Pseudenhygromyxa sp. WMMC2535 TaxID=2712867 RepID=UPI001553C7D7|nr:aromatic ring-hydroxylating dioxygenase subunit alpha [Pseudenhygromyxa sp. WMMC2535]NVB39860.1 aromatic ring-hydroxylating dioxygenase subunit alpha [Pseudenhygromyxa sp. WMMC2535]
MSSRPRSAGGARSLEARYYCSNAIFAEEIERIFMRRWLYAGRAESLTEAGSRMVFELAPECRGPELSPRESALIVRAETGELRGFYNLCRHRGARLCAGPGVSPSRTLRCPYHAWTYALDGRLIGAPQMDEVAGFDRADYPLHSLATAQWQGGVFVNFADAPAPLAEAFAALAGKLEPWRMPSLRVAARREYEIAANWKLIFENYVECYHCPIIHPRLEAVSPARAADNDLEQGELLGGPMRLVGVETLSEDGRRCGPLLVDGPARTQVFYYTIFPALFIALHPDYVLTYRLDPTAVDRTRITCEWLFDPGYVDDSASDPERAVVFWDRVNREDKALTESNQLGVRSRAYVPGPYAERESLSAAFDRAYLAALGHDAR